MKQLSYPHPVMGHRDDFVTANSEYEIYIDPAHGETKLDIYVLPTHFFQELALKTGNKTIDDMVCRGEANWYLQLVCSETYFRRTERLDPLVPSCDLATSDVEGELRMTLLVLAEDAVVSYKPIGTNPDYSGASFGIEEKDLLALYPEQTFNIDPQFNQYDPEPSSFIKISKDQTRARGEIFVNWDDDKIDVQMPYKDYQLFHDAEGLMPTAPHSSIAFPVLISALRRRKDQAHTRWAQRLEKVLESKDIGENVDCFEAAQKILENPVQRAFDEIIRSGRQKGE